MTLLLLTNTLFVLLFICCGFRSLLSLNYHSIDTLLNSYHFILLILFFYFLSLFFIEFNVDVLAHAFENRDIP